MTEREPIIDNDDAYWGHDVVLGEARIGRETSTVRMHLHVSDEPYYLREELLPLRHKSGDRAYVHGRPYVLEPEIRLTVDLYPTPTQDGAVGTVASSEWEGMRHREIGNAQAWYYPADHLLVLWECYLFDFARQKEPIGDTALRLVWTGFEETLLNRFPDAARIATPSWEDIYERPAWQQFLAGRGYEPFSPGCFVKKLDDADVELHEP
ncbi:MAG: hypothetical protein ACRDJW_01335 [Thermomicrobiales bacterium]